MGMGISSAESLKSVAFISIQIPGVIATFIAITDSNLSRRDLDCIFYLGPLKKINML